MKKVFALLLMLSLSVVVISGCGKGKQSGQNANGEKSYTIGVSMKTLQDQFSKTVADAIEARGEELGNVKIIMMDASADVNTQISQVENLVSQSVDVVILNPQDADGSSPALDLCNEAKIPVVEVNTITKNENYQSYVGSSDDEAGAIQGNFVKKALKGKGNVAIMYGNMGQSPQILRKKGLDQTLLKAPGIKLLADKTANWQRADAMALAEDWLQRFPKLNAICAQNDDMAMGALQAVEAAGRKDIIVVGVDAIPDALQAVKEGRMACTVFQDAKGQGSTAVDVALDLAKGNKVKKTYIIPFQLVTKENAAKFIGKNKR